LNIEKIPAVHINYYFYSEIPCIRFHPVRPLGILISHSFIMHSNTYLVCKSLRCVNTYICPLTCIY